MTPEEVFAQLRDIHTPATQKTLGYGLDPWPLLVFTFLVMAIFGVRFWMRWRHRRNRLAGIDSSLPPGAQRDQIARILSTAPRRHGKHPIPSAYFAPPSRLTTGDAAELRRWARRRLG